MTEPRPTGPTPDDRRRAFMRTLRRGQHVTGTVTALPDFGVTFVDLGGCTAIINVPELSWRPFDHPSDIVSVGQVITARVIDVDLTRDRVSLSLKALSEDPMRAATTQTGRTVTGTSEQTG
ncbi:S1 RNA-binding domain-containing protein [Streptomyces termitum]|uniref:S1 RNA-binding domain-containing protein n=1 Tax=Streptomyces termitum TaxID=67368 RepID=UPI0033B1EA8A